LLLQSQAKSTVARAERGAIRFLLCVPVVTLVAVLDVLGTTLLVRRLKRRQEQSELS